MTIRAAFGPPFSLQPSSTGVACIHLSVCHCRARQQSRLRGTRPRRRRTVWSPGHGQRRRRNCPERWVCAALCDRAHDFEQILRRQAGLRGLNLQDGQRASTCSSGPTATWQGELRFRSPRESRCEGGHRPWHRPPQGSAQEPRRHQRGYAALRLHDRPALTYAGYGHLAWTSSCRAMPAWPSPTPLAPPISAS